MFRKTGQVTRDSIWKRNSKRTGEFLSGVSALSWPERYWMSTEGHKDVMSQLIPNS
jgi:hypothetical protein